MGIAFLHGNGGYGGSGGLDLTVVGGTTRPAKATQNTIWVDTNAEITSYVISATQPSAPTEGMLWISIDDSGGIKMTSPVGGDWITVYPLKAKLCISGSWVDVEAMSYQDGVWVEWIRYIFRSGDGEQVPLKVYKQSDATVTIDNNSITQNFATSGNLIAKIQTENPLSLTNKNVIYARVKCVRKYTSEAYTARLAISHDAKDDFNGNTEIASAYFQNDSKETIYEIPVTTSGSYYVYIWGVGEYTLYGWWIE